MDTVQSLHSVSCVSIGQAQSTNALKSSVCWFGNILAYLYDHLTGGMTDC